MFFAHVAPLVPEVVLEVPFQRPGKPLRSPSAGLKGSKGLPDPGAASGAILGATSRCDHTWLPLPGRQLFPVLRIGGRDIDVQGAQRPLPVVRILCMSPRPMSSSVPAFK